MRLHQFFGVLLGKDPYRIESAPLKLLPKNGYNSYFPLPFQSSCRITLRNTGQESTSVWSMVNWQKYDKRLSLTPYRLHAQFTEEKPAEPLGTTLLGAIRGSGFVAGLFHAVQRHDYRDMIWHTGGDTWLIDGETNPHVLRGIGSEDLFGHSFGMYPDMSEWTGAPHVVGLGRRLFRGRRLPLFRRGQRNVQLFAFAALRHARQRHGERPLLLQSGGESTPLQSRRRRNGRSPGRLTVRRGTTSSEPSFRRRLKKSGRPNGSGEGVT